MPICACLMASSAMHTLIINLAHATDRMGFMQAQLNALGLAWDRVEAVTPQTLSPGADDPVWQRWQRPLRTTEMALCASHMAVWRRVVALDAPCLVLEDDAVLAADTPAFLQLCLGMTGVDHISLETRGRKKLVARRLDPRAPMRRLWQDRTGSAAYVLFPQGARKLLAHADRAGGPSDAVISSTYSLRSYQADPALAIQLDQCARYGIRQLLATQSLIDAVRKPGFSQALPLRRRLAFRARRIAAQLRMALRHLVYGAVAMRAHVDPSPSFEGQEDAGRGAKTW